MYDRESAAWGRRRDEQEHRELVGGGDAGLDGGQLVVEPAHIREQVVGHGLAFDVDRIGDPERAQGSRGDRGGQSAG
jgi:hypothetical protein